MKVFDCDSFDCITDNLNANGIYVINNSKNPYEIYVENLRSEYIIVGFTGQISRKYSSPPYFSFRKLSKSLNVGLISISDPSLKLESTLELSWYIGNKINGNIAKELALFLDRVITLTDKRLILCGGSGGGFAALNIQSLMVNKIRTSCLVWNPQTDITRYSTHKLIKYLNACYGFRGKTLNEAISFLEKNSIDYSVKVNNENDRLIMVNGYDPYHIRKQVRRFIGISNNSSVFIDDWGDGHVPPPKDLLHEILTHYFSGKSSRDVGEFLRDNKASKNNLLFFVNGKYLDDVLELRATTIRRSDHRIVNIRSNIYDFFKGYNLKYSIFKDKKIIYKSRYLYGVDKTEISFEIPDKAGIYNRQIEIELLVEDLLGVQKIYRYNLAKINTIAKVTSVNF